MDYEPINNFHLNFNTKYIGKQYIDNTENSDRILNAYLVQNLLFSYTIKNKLFKELTFQLAINNLFDAKYETNAWVYKYIEGGKLQTQDGYFPQALINYMLRVDVKF